MMQRAIRYGKSRYWTTVAVATVLPGVATAVIEYIVANGVKGLWPIAIAVMGGCLTMLALKLIKAPDFSEVASPTEISLSLEVPAYAGRLVEGRFFSPRTPDELVAEITGQTDIVAAEAIKRHIGHWLRVAGSVRDVSDRGGSVLLYIDLSDSRVSFSMEFNREYWRERLVAYNKGDQVVAIGQINYINSHIGGVIRLDDCEFVG